MKKTAILLTVLSLALGSLHAQNVPPFMNYQGRVTVAGGGGLGDPTPEARKVVFRLFATTTGGSTLWSEEQTVTLSKGDFSVLLGLGIAFGAEPHDALDTVFTGDRYLEITVDNGDGTINGSDTPITPRQRITSTAYSFRAKTADSVVGGSIGTASLADTSVTLAKMASGSVSSTAIVDSSIATADLADGSVNSAKIADGQVALADLAGNSVNSSKVVDLSIATADLADASVTKAKLGTDVGVWDIASGNAYRSTGNVGIGFSTAPVAKLEVHGPAASTLLRLKPTSDNWFVSEMVDFAGTQRFYTGIAKNSSDFVWGTGPGDAAMGVSGAKKLFINAIGVAGQPVESVGIVMHGNNVGIGTTSPVSKLSVNCITNQVGENNASFASPNIGTGVCFIHYGTLGDVYFRSANTTSGRVIIQDQGGNVGIGTTSPGRKLQVGDQNVAGSVGIIRVGHNNGAGSFRSWEFGTGDSSIFGNADNFGFRDFSGGAIMTLRSSDNGGNVGIGRTDPGFKLDVNGGIRCVGAVNTSSDARLKTNIQGLAGALDKTLRLRGVSYDWNRAAYPTKGLGDKHQLGFIAQEVRKVLPDVVMEDAEGFLSIGYTAIIPVLTEAVKELHTKHVSATQELARKVEALEKAHAEKDTALTAMTQRLAALEAKDKARDAKLTAIEAMLSGDKPAALPVSLKKSVGGAE